MNVLEIFGICFIVEMTIVMLLVIFVFIVSRYSIKQKQKEYEALVKKEEELKKEREKELQKERNEYNKNNPNLRNVEKYKERLSKSIEEEN